MSHFSQNAAFSLYVRNEETVDVNQNISEIVEPEHFSRTLSGSCKHVSVLWHVLEQEKCRTFFPLKY